MKSNTGLFFVLALISVSCSYLDEPTHGSYDELNKFLNRENLHKKFKIENIKVDWLALSDSIDYRPDNKHIHNRKLQANYEFRLISKEKEYFSKAAIVSVDSIVWRVKTLMITEKDEINKIKTEKTYTWDLNKGSVGRRIKTVETKS